MSERRKKAFAKVLAEVSKMGLKEKVEKWKKRMLENPPPEPSFSEEERDYYDEEYARRKLGF